jgi:hypothetical protein
MQAPQSALAQLELELQGLLQPVSPLAQIPAV